jgi:hypothetical protein
VAYKRADAKIWLGSLIPITAFSTLFRMTYWEFSWDIVEPISFFVSTMGPIVFFYLWFAKHKTGQFPILSHCLLLLLLFLEASPDSGPSWVPKSPTPKP